MINCTAGSDYGAGPYNVTFRAGETLDSFNLTITDDTLVEGKENFTLSVDQSSLPDSVSISDHNEATVTILDNDCKLSY